MKNAQTMRWHFVFILVAIALFSTAKTSAQNFSYNIERRKRLTQVSTNPVPFLYQFYAEVALRFGTPSWQSGEVRAPQATNALYASGAQMTFLTNFPAVSWEGTNLVLGIDRLNALYPTGTYELRIVTTNSGGQPSFHNFFGQLTNDFPMPDPIITNIPALTHLQPTQVFSWPLFNTNSMNGNYTVFQLYEGQFDTNLLAELASGNMESLTNFTRLTPLNSNLAPTNNSLTVSNIDVYLDHLALLEFHEVVPSGSLLGKVASIASNFILYRALPPPVSLNIARTNQSVILTWPTNGGAAYRLTFSQGLTNWVLVPMLPSTNAGGFYEVIQPADVEKVFYELRAE